MKPVLDYYLEHGDAGFLPGCIAETAGMDHLYLEGTRIRFLKKAYRSIWVDTGRDPILTVNDGRYLSPLKIKERHLSFI